MDARVREIQPMVSEPWIKYDHDIQAGELTRSVAGRELGLTPKVEGSERPEESEKRASSDSNKTKTFVDEVQSYVEDLNTQVDSSFQDKSGNLIVTVLDRETGDIIRQIPPEDLMAFREKLNELRGVLFDGKV